MIIDSLTWEAVSKWAEEEVLLESTPKIPLWSFYYVADDGSGDEDCNLIRTKYELVAAVRALWWLIKTAWSGKYLLWKNLSKVHPNREGLTVWLHGESTGYWGVVKSDTYITRLR